MKTIIATLTILATLAVTTPAQAQQCPQPGPLTQTVLQQIHGTNVKHKGTYNPTGKAAELIGECGETMRVHFPKNKTWKQTNSHFKAQIPAAKRKAVNFDFTTSPNFNGHAGKLLGFCIGLEHGDCANGGSGAEGTKASARIARLSDGTTTIYAYHIREGNSQYGQHFPLRLDGKPVNVTDGETRELRLYMKLNTPGVNDGVIIAKVNGRTALYVKNLRFVDNPDSRIVSLHNSSMLGKAPSKDLYWDVSNIKVW